MLRSFIALSFLTAAATPFPASAGNLDVQVLSATAKNKVVPGAQVIFQKEGQTSLTATTDAQGRASARNAFGVDDPSVSMIVKKEGFSPLVVKCPCSGMSYAMSETIQQIEAFRVVLNWGNDPLDLDLHTVYRNNHVYFEHKQGTDSFLDVDDTDGYGPETITIRQRHQGDKYVFAVHNYSAAERYGTRVLSQNSKAKVFVYVGQSLIKSYYIPAGQVGALWVLFAVDENGVIHDINNVVDIAEYKKVGYYLKQLTERADFGVTTRASLTSAERAKDLSRKGDEAMQAGDAERAIERYQQAIEQDPNLGKAYASLSQAYSKLNRTAEAAWASRKAAEIGRLPDTGYRVPNDRVTLQASSAMKDWKQYTFVAPNLIDDNLWTSWQPVTKPGGGVGEWVKMTFASPQTLTGFEFSNGFRRIDDFGDLYVMNNRIQRATLEFSDGSAMAIQFADTPTEHSVVLPAPKRCDWVKLVVNSVYKGTKWNDLAVSEFHALAKEE